MELSDVEVRVLGCLIEKELTTPDHYPLTTNALVAACNQKSNRSPVVEYDEHTVEAALLSLRQQGLARTITGSGRSLKHRQVMADGLQLDEGAIAVVGVLAVRGPQTAGELRTRTARAHGFAELEDVGAVLQQLAERPDPLAVQLGRAPGQKEARWTHLLTGEVIEDVGQGPPATPPEMQPAVPSSMESPADLIELKREVVELRGQIAELYRLLGEDPPA
jgi:uncharacterized protein YceH (UPF0502 family)